MRKEREISVESIRSYCSLVPSKGNLCLLYVIAVKLLFLGPRKLNVLGNRPPSHHFIPNTLNFRGTEPCTLPDQGRELLAVVRKHRKYCYCERVAMFRDGSNYNKKLIFIDAVSVYSSPSIKELIRLLLALYVTQMLGSRYYCVKINFRNLKKSTCYIQNI
jgi:hypothetical protein